MAAITTINPRGIDTTGNYVVTSINASSNVVAGNIKTDHLLYSNGSPYVFTTNAAGTNTQIQFNDSNSFAGSANLTFDKTSGTLTVAYISGNGSSLTSVNAATLNGHSDTYFASQTDVSNAIANLVNSAPSALDTLNELANALGNDASYSTTITNALANKLSTTNFNSTANTWISLQTTSNLAEGSNLYYTIPRANTAIDNRVTKTFIDNLGVVANIANIAYSVDGANVTGAVSSATTSGTVTTAAQPNITSVGTLTSLDVSGTSNLGPVGNVIISGGTSGQFLKTDGTGNLTWASASAGSAATVTYTPAFKGALLFAAANTAMSAATWTKISFTTVSYDTTGGALTGTASRFTIPAGVSKIKLKGEVSGSSVTDQLITVFYKNGAGIGASTTVDIESTGQDSSPAFSAVLPVIQGDYFELWAYSGLARDALNLSSTWFAIEIVEGSILNTTVSTTIGMSTLSDVDVTTASPANGQALIWSSSSSKWIPSNASNLTSVGTLSNLAVTGNITSGNANLGNLVAANFFSGNGHYLTSILGTQVTGEVAFANKANSVAGANVTGQVGNALVAGTVYTNAQPNITSVGTLASVSVTGNANVGNLNASSNLYVGASLPITSVTSKVQIRGQTGQDPLSITNSDAAEYVVLNFFNNSNIQMGSVGAGNPSTTYYANQTFLWGANGLALSGNGYSATGGTKNLFISNAGIVTVPTGVAATNTTTGALVVTGGVGVSANLYAGNLSGTNITGTLTTAAQPNITSVGSLTSLTVTGNITSGNASLGNIASANIMNIGTATRPANVQANGALFVVSNTVSTSPPISIQNRFATGYSSMDIFSSSNVFLGAIGGANPSATTVPALSNAVYVYSETATGIGLYASIGNVSMSAAGNANIFVVTGTGANVNGYANITGNVTASNANLGNLATANFFSGNGHYLTDILGTQITGEVAFANKANSVAGANVSGEVSFAATANSVAGANVSGAVSYATTANAVAGANVSGQVGNAIVAGTVYTAAQPNITSVGTLTSLTVSGTSTLGAVGNVKITGGTTGQYLKTDGTGNLSWATVSGSGGVSGTDTQVIFNDSGAYAGNAGFTFDKANTKLTVNNFVATSTANLGAVGNVIITGGTTGQVLKTDGSGGLSWGTAAGSESTVTSVDNFTGDGTTTDFTLSVTPANKNQTLVNYNGAMQLKAAYSLSGAVITFSEAPANGSLIEVITQMGVTTGAGNLTVRTFTGTGSQTDFSVSSGVNATNILVTENGVLQVPTTDYTVSSGTLSFVVAPASGVNIQVRELGTSISTITPAGSDTQVLFNDAGSFGNSASFTFNKTSKTLTTGSILPATDLTYSLGNSTRRWSNLYLAGNTIHLGNATISVDDTTGAVLMTPAPTVANPNPTAQTVSAPRYVSMVTTGSLTATTGTSRYYPPANMQLSSVAASLSTASTTTFTFKLLKNGTIVGTYSITANEFRLTPATVSISVTTTDYLTVDITAGDGASDLRIDLGYTFA